MKALAIHDQGEIQWEERPVPEPGEGEVRLRVAYVGICGSDLHYYFHGANGEYAVREPLTPGHELSATVDLDPSGALAPGTPVTVHPARYGRPVPGLADSPHLWPGGDYLGSAATLPHRQGGAAEYLVVEAGMIRVLPEGLPLTRAALAEPLAVALHAVRRAGGVRGAKVLVNGAGPIGLLVVAAALESGAATVDAADIRQEPLARARGLGAQETWLAGPVASPAVPDPTATTHPDAASTTEPAASAGGPPAEAYGVVFECSGVAAGLTTAVRSVGRAGTVVQVGILPNTTIGVNLAPLLAKEATLEGTFRFVDEIDDAVRMLHVSGLFDRVITDVVPAAEAERAFALARDSAASAKVLLRM